MSHFAKSSDEATHDSLAERLRDSLIFDSNKPDFRELDLGSSRAGAGATSSTSSSSSSSSSSSGAVAGKSIAAASAAATQPIQGSNATSSTKSHSGEFPRSAEANRSAGSARHPTIGHRRSKSTGPPLIFSGGSFSSSSGSSGSSSTSSCCNGVSTSPSVTSNLSSNLLPSGNICPSGKILKAGIGPRTAGKAETLGTGTGKYGHGSVMRGHAGKMSASGELGLTGNIQFAGESMMLRRAMASSDPDEVKKAGNEQYRRGHFAEALSLYDRAIALLPDNAACRSNRAAALTALGKLGEAVKECEEAVRLDPGYARAHQRLASLYHRMGLVENAQYHLTIIGLQSDPAELQKLHALDKRLSRCADARKIGDWKSALRECDAALVAGADSCPQLLACKAEALLKLHQLEDADSIFSNMTKLESHLPFCSQVKFFGMLSEAYLLYVRAQVDMAMGRFENAVAAAEKAGMIDYSNIEGSMLLSNVKLVARARARGNEFFNLGKFSEACSAYGEGLKYDASNSVLYCNRAVCWSKLGLWEQSVEDCNKALKIQPNYVKALLRRAVSNGKLERWADAVRDYEILRRELPGDSEVAESLFHAQVALKKLRGEVVHNMKFGGEVEQVSGLDQFKAAISSTGTSVVHFKAAANQQCEQIAPFINLLCIRYPSVNFLEVDVEHSPALAKAENIRIVPTFKIYKNGGKVKEMICPSQQILEYSVKHYSR